MHHFDAGSRYTCGAYTHTQTLTDHGVLASIGTVGDALHNAPPEYSAGSFKTELIADRVWRNAPRPSTGRQTRTGGTTG